MSPDDHSAIRLALHDAATNCSRDGATAVLTLRSGKQVSGQLEKPTVTDTAHVKTLTGGWATVLVAEIAVVEAVRPEARDAF